jgi:hypothetical protein
VVGADGISVGVDDCVSAAEEDSLFPVIAFLMFLNVANNFLSPPTRSCVGTCGETEGVSTGWLEAGVSAVTLGVISAPTSFGMNIIRSYLLFKSK